MNKSMVKKIVIITVLINDYYAKILYARGKDTSSRYQEMAPKLNHFIQFK